MYLIKILIKFLIKLYFIGKLYNKNRKYIKYIQFSYTETI